MRTNNCALFILFTLLSLWVFAEGEKPEAEFNQAHRLYQAAADKQNFEAALPYAKTALELGIEVYGEESKNVASLNYNYALSLFNTNKIKEARSEFDRTVDRYKKIYGNNNEALVRVYMDAGRADTRGFDINGGLRNFRAALDIVKDHYKKESLEYAAINFEIGRTLLDKVAVSNAKRYLEDALEILEKVQGKNDINTAMASFYLGKYHLTDKKYSRAEPYFVQAVNALAESGEQYRPVIQVVRGCLVEVYENLDESDKATEQLQAIARAAPGRGSGNYQPVYRVEATYPKIASELRQEGFVVVEFMVTKEGKVVEPRIIEREGHLSFERASMEAVKKWRFAPRFVDGEAVDTEGVLTRLKFKLVD